MKRPLRMILAAFLVGSPLFPLALAADTGFFGLDLSGDNTLLFSATADSPRYGSFDTLFLADTGKGRLTQLTFFPETLTVLPSAGTVQLQNRFGLFRGTLEGGEPQPVDGFPAFVRDNLVERGAERPVQTSPDGRYLLYVRPASAAYGDLVLLDVQEKRETVVSRQVEIDLSDPPSAWSPEGDCFVYARADTLYYYSLLQLRENRVIAEEYREIGRGGVRNVRWGGGGFLYYVSGSLVYRLDSRELFTRALYSGYLPLGTLVGKIPFAFDGNFDRFWVSPSAEEILLDKGGRNLFLYPLSTEDFAVRGVSLPYLYLPRNRSVKRVLWGPPGAALTVLSAGIENGGLHTSVYSLPVPGPGAATPAGGEAPRAFREIAPGEVRDLVLSPDGKRIAVLFADRVTLVDAVTWRQGAVLAHDQPLHACWAGEGRLVVAGSRTGELWDPATGQSRLLFLCQPGTYSFAEGEEGVVAQVGGQAYRRGLGTGPWAPAPAVTLRQKRPISDGRRVYLEDAPGGPYRNMIMVRDTRGFGTWPLLSRPLPDFEAFPPQEEPVSLELFAHGSRIRRREAALVFNVIDSIEGLPGILSTLNDYRVRATFFVNGEAIRRYPDAVKEIAQAGHEVGSLFYVYFNMTDSRFRLDKEFIKRGLARNEDEYFAATGRELGLLWHAPHYFVSSDIVEASREMNYLYVGRDVEVLDWVTREMSLTAQDLYLPAAALVERIVAEKKPGSIIPVRVGAPRGGREDYLFQKVDLLIDALLDRGYSVVPVTTLVEHAR